LSVEEKQKEREKGRDSRAKIHSAFEDATSVNNKNNK
jgi:hypothetical protein